MSARCAAWLESLVQRKENLFIIRLPRGGTFYCPEVVLDSNLHQGALCATVLGEKRPLIELKITPRGKFNPLGTPDRVIDGVSEDRGSKPALKQLGPLG